MGKLRVAHIMHSYLPMTQNWIYNQLAHNRACKPYVLCQTLENVKHFPLDNVHPVYTQTSLRSHIALQCARVTARYFSSHHKRQLQQIRPDILHAHFAFEAWRNFEAIRHAGRPLVISFYGNDVTKLWRRRVWKRRYSKLFEYAAAIMVEGSHMGACIASMGCPPQKIRVIKIGIDLARIRQKVAVADNVPVRILFVGLSREKKGPAYAAETFCCAARQCPNLELHIIGDGSNRPLVESIFERNAIQSQVTMHGSVTVDKYYELLGSMDLCLTPSVTAKDGDTEGGAPVTAIEALACGVPVVGSTHCDIPNVVTHGKTGLLCDEKDVESLAHNLLTLATNTMMRSTFAKAGKQYAQQEHDIRVQTQKIADLYTSLRDNQNY
ncbi:MAG: glycosyltransferase [Chitinivibrionales bacterium]|nr:glycosyltransferase [Chitinivibrionales bacterium]